MTKFRNMAKSVLLALAVVCLLGGAVQAREVYDVCLQPINVECFTDYTWNGSGWVPVQTVYGIYLGTIEVE